MCKECVRAKGVEDVVIDALLFVFPYPAQTADGKDLVVAKGIFGDLRHRSEVRLRLPISNKTTEAETKVMQPISRMKTVLPSILTSLSSSPGSHSRLIIPLRCVDPPHPYLVFFLIISSARLAALASITSFSSKLL